MEPPQGAEQRRGVRVRARFFVRVIGVDAHAKLRDGNISVSGVFFECETAPADVGRVERLEIKSADGAASIVVSAVLVRLSRTQDLWQGDKVAAAAYRFLPDNAELDAAIAALVKHVAAAALARPDGLIDAGRVAASFDEGDAGPRQAHLGVVGRHGLSLITEWPVAPGARVAITIREGSDDHPVAIEGVVEHNEVVTPGRTFRVDVRMAGDEGGHERLEHAVTRLVDALVAPERSAPLAASTHALAGDLSRVPLTSVLSFVEWEEWTGTLALERAGERARVFVAKGRPLDVEASFSARTPRVAFRVLLDWTDGAFTLTRDDAIATRADTMATTVRELVLDLAREQDESR